MLTKELSKLQNVLEGHSRNQRNASRAVWADRRKAFVHHNTGEISQQWVMMYRYVFGFCFFGKNAGSVSSVAGLSNRYKQITYNKQISSAIHS